tara:strand:- start:1318 stop:2520 length:1203 start_codon:yes stop_codon:yes gene_type:complete
VDTTNTITHLSLCSGYEGIGLGLRRIFPNLREIAYVEREGFVAANLVAKMEEGKLDAAPVHTDVKTFPYRKFRGCVDILSGGFPCQPFSAAGNRQATEDPRHLFPYIADGIRECQPRIVFLENVQGILSCSTGDGEPVLQYVLRTLEELGYRATAGIFSAEEVGAPHQRKRVFILGVSYELGNASSKRCKQNSSLRSKQQSSWTNEVSRESRSELGNASDIRPREHSSDSRETGTDQSGKERRMYESQGASSLPEYGSQQNCSTELADSNNSGGNQDRQPSKLRTGWVEQSPIHRWPARPGEAQQEWEEPRVTAVADSKSQQGSSSDNGAEPRATCESKQSQLGGGHSGSLRESNRQTKPELGGATNGYNSRVDRLRLLGNGVVPATATKAFVTLIQRVI